ncbi:thermolabile hemolysin (plasmid) [Legionella adelaidensis]|uniref:Thermolabile hemolysin n=1 Tax=Legionella adelaidensis TaxID=45056 RepID=A0A0W0R5H9_9GAMM|nr:SGNH/GDSL hydrolase family protein [Legionella adelaidensis]KTC66320.1 putative thermolabile hemolysin [Legionella adelaidensis]VEH84917.1 thermolabile hemolysin [Legionella adelaidensis]
MTKIISARKKVAHVIMMGDSLSDRGTLERRKLLGVIPMVALAGLQRYTALGRFTNGLAWSDLFSAHMINRFLIEELEEKQHKKGDMDVADRADDILTHRSKKNREATEFDEIQQKKEEHFGLRDDDIADGIISDDLKVQPFIEGSYTFDNDLYVKYQGRDFVRNYDEGGLTADDYRNSPTLNIPLCASRWILANLKQKREALLAYDAKNEVSTHHKKQTLVMEWSGGNDFITVNSRPSKEVVERVLKARIANVEALIKNGYRHFVLINLPDLSLTPRFQAKSKEEQENASRWCQYFNERLQEECQRLQKTYVHCSTNVFDVASIFNRVYHNPTAYGFAADKLTKPYTRSPDFRINKDHTSPSQGYMFWDDIHPTMDMHAILAQEISQYCEENFDFVAPKEEAVQKEVLHIAPEALKAAFITEYEKTLKSALSGWFGIFRRSRIDYKNASLVDILRHALDNQGHRTREVITKLQWIDSLGNLNLNIPALKKAKGELDRERELKSSAVGDLQL